jgi:hypothetical protein
MHNEKWRHRGSIMIKYVCYNTTIETPREIRRV